MQPWLTDHLCCPETGDRLVLVPIETADGDVTTGLLVGERHAYPITNGVPRLLPDAFRFADERVRRHLDANFPRQAADLRAGATEEGQRQVQHSFGAKWNRQPDWGHQGSTKEFAVRWNNERFGWDGGPRVEGRFVLDAGCGSGICTRWFAEGNPHCEVFGVDISNSVDAARDNLRALPNVHIIQADLNRLPFSGLRFDYVFSNGVLHHTPSTEQAFRNIGRFLAEGGEMAIYVYRKKAAIREFCDDHVRESISPLPPEAAWKDCEAITKLGKALSDLHAELNIPEDIPSLGIKAGTYDLQRFFYYNILKCFWNDEIGFDNSNHVNYDWYHPVYSWRHTREELLSWHRDLGLSIVHFHEEEAGYTIRSRKTATPAPG